MAIWQVDFALEFKKGEIRHTEKELLCCESEFVKNFPRTQSWSESIIQYGDIDSTCIEFYFENEKIESIRMRIDLREITAHELNVLCGFLRINNLLIKYDEQLLEAEFDNIINVIRISDANRFITDPVKFLKSLRVQRIFNLRNE